MNNNNINILTMTMGETYDRPCLANEYNAIITNKDHVDFLVNLYNDFITDVNAGEPAIKLNECNGYMFDPEHNITVADRIKEIIHGAHRITNSRCFCKYSLTKNGYKSIDNKHILAIGSIWLTNLNRKINVTFVSSEFTDNNGNRVFGPKFIDDKENLLEMNDMPYDDYKRLLLNDTEKASVNKALIKFYYDTDLECDNQSEGLI